MLPFPSGCGHLCLPHHCQHSSSPSLRLILTQFLGVFNIWAFIWKPTIVAFRSLFCLANRTSFHSPIQDRMSHGRCRRRITCIGLFLARFLGIFDVQRLIWKLIIVCFKCMFYLANRLSFHSQIQGWNSMRGEEEGYMLLVRSLPNFWMFSMFNGSFESWSSYVSGACFISPIDWVFVHKSKVGRPWEIKRRGTHYWYVPCPIFGRFWCSAAHLKDNHHSFQ